LLVRVSLLIDCLQQDNGNANNRPTTVVGQIETLKFIIYSIKRSNCSWAW